MSRPYPCVYCTEDGYCEKYSDEEVTSWCIQGPCEDEKPSNADRIRAMSDEDLAMLLQPGCPSRVCRDSPPHDCYNCWLDWLKEEAKDGRV